jgi:signal transduction histidine kinase
MKTKTCFFLQSNPFRALAESLLLSALLAIGLLLVGEQIPANTIDQGFFLLLLIAALWCASRLRLPQGTWQKRLIYEGATALALSLALAAGLPLVITTIGWGDKLAQANLATTGIVLLLLTGGLVFAILRVIIRLGRYWNRLRRQRLIWSLTHAHLLVVVAVVLLIAAILGVQLVVWSQDVPQQGPSASWLSILIDTLTRTIFPFSAFVVIGLVVLLVLLLPPSAIFSYFIARQTTRRLESLAEATTALRQGDLSARAPVEGQDEVAQLQADFNAMAADLEQATEAIQAERDKVIQLLQSRRDLISNVSHELRTPVTTMRGYLESALGKDETIPADLHHDLAIIEKEAQRLQRLIDDLFALSQAEVEQLTLDIKPSDIAAVIQNRVEAIAPLAWQTSRVEVVANVPPMLPLALVDPTRLEQVLTNLLRNGIRHTPPGGIVVVRACSEKEYLRVEVCDTGEGIPSEEIPHVWQRFYRGEEAKRKDSRGAGLGLALVKELTEAMGGTVAVKSRPDQGTCFLLKLPRG